MKTAIAFEPTPNPDAGKFTVDRTLVEGRTGRSFDSVAAAAGDPLARSLLALPGVRSVFMVADFVTVIKEPRVRWSVLAPRIERALRTVLAPAGDES